MLRRDTERLVLRPFRDSDLPSFLGYRSDPEVARYQSWDTPYAVDEAAGLIAEMKAKMPGTPGQWYQIAIELKATGEHVGDCAFHISFDDSEQAEIGFTVARAFQGHGYATEAVKALLGYLFEVLHLRRVIATCDARNVRSARLLERLGLRREAHFVANVRFKGELGSEYLFAMLAWEWRGPRGDPVS
jgi:aminoglycoside 6'-N-acetyltransferase